jgi:hypothetical protein
MPAENSLYEAFVWVLTRECIGQSLREHYQVPTELPPALLTLARKLDAVESDLQLAKELPLSLLTLVRKLDTLEGNLLLHRMPETPAGHRKTPTVN